MVFFVDGRQAVVGEVDEEIDSRIDLSSGVSEIGVWMFSWMFPKIVVAPKWMVYNGKPY